MTAAADVRARPQIEHGTPVAASRDRRLLARGGSLGLFGVAVSGGLQLALVAAVTRGLGPGGAGLLLEAMAMFMILSKVGELGASTSLVRTLSRYRALGQTGALRATLTAAMVPVASVGALLSIGAYALAPEVAGIFFRGPHASHGVTYVHLFALAVPLASLTTVALAATRGFGTMLPYVAVQNLGLPAIRLVLIMAVVAAGLGTTAAALGWLVPVIVGFSAAAVILVRLLRRAERADGASARGLWPVGAVASEFWRFSAARGIAGMLGITVTWMDVLLVGALRSTREAGIYAAASRLGIVGAYALQAVGMVIAPRVSALLAQRDPARVEALYRTATWWLMALSWPLYATLAVGAPVVMGVFGRGFDEGESALVVLSLAMLINLATGNVTTVLLMGGKSSWNLFNAGISLALNLTLNLILTPRMGITGAALAWAASILFVNISPVVQVRAFLGLRAPLGSGFWIVALGTGLCYGAIGLLIRATLGMTEPAFAVFVPVSTALYAAWLWRFRDALQVGEFLESFALRSSGRGGVIVAAERHTADANVNGPVPLKHR